MDKKQKKPERLKDVEKKCLQCEKKFNPRKKFPDEDFCSEKCDKEYWR